MIYDGIAYLEDTRIPQSEPAGVLVAPGGFLVVFALMWDYFCI